MPEDIHVTAEGHCEQCGEEKELQNGQLVCPSLNDGKHAISLGINFIHNTLEKARKHHH